MEIPTCRRPTLSHQLAMMDSSNLRDLLRVREAEDEVHRDDNSRLGGTVTLATVLAFDKSDVSSPSSFSSSVAPVPSRSLLDIIRDEDDARDLLSRHEQNNGGGHRICWKSFRERLRLHRATASCSSAATQSSSTMRSQLDDSTNGSARRQPEMEQTRVSLMALLEEQTADRTGNTGHESSAIAAAMIGMVDEEGTVTNERKMTTSGVSTNTMDDVGGLDRGVHICCVCMVRHKGSAFIPCGHTFCRLCSRELWVSRGNCPLCNAFILEILDIF